MAKKRRRPQRPAWRNRRRLPPAPARAAAPERPPAPRNVTWAQAAGQPETTAGLDALPGGLHFPENFPEPIAYDPDHKVLRYRGFMYRGSYDYLRRLAGDLAYLTALEELYAASAGRPSRRGLLVLGAAAVLLAALVAWWWR